MNRKVLQGILFLFLVALNSHAQECPLKSISVKPFIAGYMGRDSLTVAEILNAGKLATKNNGFEVLSFYLGTGNGCVGGGGMPVEIHCKSNDLTGEAYQLLKRGAGRTFFFSHAHARNSLGEMYCLAPIAVHLKEPKLATPCVSIAAQAFIAGHPGATSLSVSEILQGGKLSISTEGYDIVSYACGSFGPGWMNEITCSGIGFSPDATQMIKSARPGQTFLFSQINVKDRAGKIFCIDSFKLIIK